MDNSKINGYHLSSVRGVNAVLGVLTLGLSVWWRHSTLRERLEGEPESLLELIAAGIASNLDVVERDIGALESAHTATDGQPIAHLEPLPFCGWYELRSRAPHRTFGKRFLQLRNTSYLCATINGHIRDRAAYLLRQETDSDRQLWVYDRILYQELLVLRGLLLGDPHYA